LLTRIAKVERKIEFLDFPLRGGEIKEFDDKRGVIGGYANYKHNLDYTDDITRDGAFRKTISDAYSRKASQHLDYLYPYLWSHDWNQIPPGGVYDADEDRKGFYTRTQFNLDLQSGRELYSSFKMGTLKKQSIGYKAIQSNFEKDAATGKNIRNLLEVAVLEISAVVFPANDLAQVDMVKSREGYNMLLVKDFNSNFQSAQLDDWQDDFADLANALQQSILAVFTPGGDPMNTFDRDIAPQLLAALREYIQEGVTLGYSNAPSSAAGVSPLMSMSGYGADESKAGYLNAQTHQHIHAAVDGIMRHAKAAKSALNSLGSGSPARRFNALAGQPVYGEASAPSYFEEKVGEEDIKAQLKMLTNSLEMDMAIRESREARESMDPLQQLTRNVENALQRVNEIKRR
jgi:HK97 family phage prohead protease